MTTTVKLGEYKGYEMIVEKEESSHPYYYRYFITKTDKKVRLWSPHGLPSFQLVDINKFKEAINIYLSTTKTITEIKKTKKQTKKKTFI